MTDMVTRLREFLTGQTLEAIIIMQPENRYYFSGFTGSAGILLISQTDNILLTDFRYQEQARQQATNSKVVIYTAQPFTALAAQISQLGLKTVGFESDFITFAKYSQLRDSISSSQLLPLQISFLRMIKCEAEIRTITAAVEIADQAFAHILSYIKPGVSEQDLAAELEYKMRRLGSERTAFATIIASGQRGALPHGKASTKLIAAGDLVIFDFGAVYQEYHSDITRTVCVGPATKQQKEIYALVLEAQMVGINAIAAGLVGSEIDALARQVIASAGYGEYFGHGLGHSLGLEIHEEPRLSPTNTNIALQPGMLVTVEPGIYIPDWGGIRIEDIVLVTEAGSKVLTQSEKRLIEV